VNTRLLNLMRQKNFQPNDAVYTIPFYNNIEPSDLILAGCTRGSRPGPACVASESLVGEHPVPAQMIEKHLAVIPVRAVARSDMHDHHPVQRVNHGGDLGVESTLGPAHALPGMAPGGIGFVAMHLHMRTVQAPALAQIAPSPIPPECGSTTRTPHPLKPADGSKVRPEADLEVCATNVAARNFS
jgi:hypothetical protein